MPRVSQSSSYFMSISRTGVDTGVRSPATCCAVPLRTSLGADGHDPERRPRERIGRGIARSRLSPTTQTQHRQTHIVSTVEA